MLTLKLVLVCLQRCDDVFKPVRVERPKIVVQGLAFRQKRPRPFRLNKRKKAFTLNPFEVDAQDVFMGHTSLSQPSTLPVRPVMAATRQMPRAGWKETFDQGSDDVGFVSGGVDQGVHLSFYVGRLLPTAVRQV